MHALDAFVGAVARVRVHRIEVQEARVRKTRKRGLGPVIALGNAYFRQAGASFHMFPAVADWQAWEGQMYRQLHDVEVLPIARGVEVPRFPGDDLCALLQRDRLARPALLAVARALRKLHERGLSHGDANLGNFVFDGAVARTIDFDARHRDDLPMAVRAADDLLALTLDIVGRGASTEAAKVVLDAYRPSGDVYEALRRGAFPRGLPARTLLRARAHAMAEAPLGRAMSDLLGAANPVQSTA